MLAQKRAISSIISDPYSSRHSGVQSDGVPGAGLKDVRDVEAEQELDVGVFRDLDVAVGPELVPGLLVALQLLVEALIAIYRRLRGRARLICRPIARGV